MNEAFRVPLSEDLSGFTAILWKHRIPHRVLEQSDCQVLLLPHTVNADQVRQLFEMWQQGDDLSGLRVQQASRAPVWQDIHKQPLTLLLIGLSIALSLLISFGENVAALEQLTFTRFQIQSEHIYYPTLTSSLGEGQWWRLISPAFLHFSIAHIIFNLLWVWVIGRRIERILGGSVLLTMFIVSALASNFAQFWDSGPMFGGMSGFVFALLGFAWLWDRLKPARIIGMPPALMGFMLFWLVLGYTGVLEQLGLGAIANTAHLVGLISGLILVAPARFWLRLRGRI